MAGPSLVFSGLPLCRVFRLLLKPFSSFWFFPVRPALAELTRLGYSVLMLDSDISIRSDPYVYLKSPPFSHYQIVIHPEGGNPGLNCGWNYVSGGGRGAAGALDGEGGDEQDREAAELSEPPTGETTKQEREAS